MSVRPPQLINSKTEKDPLTAALEQEVFNEKASTLIRLTKKLETALATLAQCTADPDCSEEERHSILAQAGEALWHVTIQRELCGLRQHKVFYDHLEVPRPVRLRMGPASSFKPNSAT